MKRVGIITYHRHNNYGAVLQAYALQKKIESMGYYSEIIDYQYKKNIWSLKKLRCKGIKLYIMGIIGPITRIPRYKKFSEFRKMMKLSPKYKKNDLYKVNKRYDICISGSDNIWNTDINGFDKSYFLDFIKDNYKKRSYASSFGSDKIDSNLEEEYGELLKNYTILGVREESGAKLIKKISNKNAYVVADPTFLISYEEWNKLLIEPNEKKHYMLAYQLVPSKYFVENVKRISKEEKLPVIYISFPMGGYVKSKCKLWIGPREWLGYIKNADIIVTDSFHGMMFSIIFKKQFYVILTQLSTRIENILKKLKLKNRIIDKQGKRDKSDIDYTKCENDKQDFVKASEEVLKKCLK